MASLRDIAAESQLSIYSFVVGLSHAKVDAGHHLAVLDLFELAPSGDPWSRVLKKVLFDGLIVHQGRLGSQEELERRVEVPGATGQTG